MFSKLKDFCVSHTWIKNRAIIVLHVTLSASVWLFLHPSILLVCAAQSVSSALFHVFTSTFSSVFFFCQCQQGWFCSLLPTTSSIVFPSLSSRPPISSSPPSCPSHLTPASPDSSCPAGKAEFLRSHGGRQQVALVLSAEHWGTGHNPTGLCLWNVR